MRQATYIKKLYIKLKNMQQYVNNIPKKSKRREQSAANKRNSNLHLIFNSNEQQLSADYQSAAINYNWRKIVAIGRKR